MAIIKDIQPGTATINIGSASTTVTITSVDTSKAYVVYSAKIDTANQSNSGRASAGYTFTSSTQLTFSRANTGGTSALEISFYVVEFTSGATVQRNTASNVPLTGTNVTISSVNTDKAFSIVNTTGDVSWDYGGNAVVAGEITSTTNLSLKSGYNSASNTVYWQVVEIDDATVDLYTGSFAASNSLTNVTIPSVNLSKTFLEGAVRRTTSSAYGGIAFHYTWRLTSDTNIRFERAGTYEDYYYAVYTVTLDSNCAVQRGDGVINASSTGGSISITQIGSNAYTRIGGINGHLSQPANTLAAESEGFINLSIDDSTHILGYRQVSGTYATTYRWQVIDLTITSVLNVNVEWIPKL